MSTPSARIRPLFGRYSPQSGLTSVDLLRRVLADDRHHRTGFQIEIHVVQHETIGAGICERQVLDADTVGETL